MGSGRRDSRRKRSRSRSASRSRTRRRSRDRRSRRSRSRSGNRRRHYRSRSRSRSSSDRERERRRHYRSRRGRHSSSSDESSRSSSSDSRRGRVGRSGQSSKAESRSSTPDSQVKMSGLARNQAMITAMLNKTDEKYKTVEARNKPQTAPVSSVLASLESDEFVPQTFVSHRTAKAGNADTVPVEKDEDKSNQGNHEAAMFGGSDTTKFSVATETSSVLEGLTSKTNQLDSLSESERLQLWLKRLKTLRELYSPPTAPPQQ